MTDDAKAGMMTAYDLAMKVAFPILLGMAGWAFNTLWDQESRLTAIESSRYSRADAEAANHKTTEVLDQLRLDFVEQRAESKAMGDRLGRMEKQLTDIAEELKSR